MPVGPKLRYRSALEPFRVVLVEPEIPPNTGAVARTCVATNSPLHLVGKLGFSLSEHAVRRAGLDYWPLLDLHQHEHVAEFTAAHPGSRLSLFSAGAPRSYLEAAPRPGDALVFGKESVGLAPELLEAHEGRVFGIPTIGGVRSLNLSNAVSIVLYEALRGCGALEQVTIEAPLTTP